MKYASGKWLLLTTICVGLMLAGAVTCARGEEPETVVLRFEDEMAAMVNARRWDETKQQWLGDSDEMFFDAAHRFLLLRYPACAEAIQQKLTEGYEVESAKLVLHWVKNEVNSSPGYMDRGWKAQLYEADPPTWHGEAWLLRRPWTDDPEIGPSWNAYVNGAGYWRRGGGKDVFADRYPRPVGKGGLWKDHPTGEIDVTEVLTSLQFGDTPGGRLRQLEACGFLIRKAELYDTTYVESWGAYDWAVATGMARIWVGDPELVVTLRKAEHPTMPGELPPAVDVRTLAASLKGRGGNGLPTTAIPEDLVALAEAHKWARPEGVPDWMWQRILELRNLPVSSSLKQHIETLESGDRERYLQLVQSLLSMPPHYWQGWHQIDYFILLEEYGDMLPDVVRDHLRQYWEAWMEPPTEEELKKRPNHFYHYYFKHMGTLNFMANARSSGILAGEMLGLSDVTLQARYGLSLLNREMIFSEGAHQEHGDTFYQGITLTHLQALSRYSEDPLTRLKAGLAVEKVLFELNATYHPRLRRQVSSCSRLYEVGHILLRQDVPREVLHTLSRRGVLIETDRAEVHGISTVDTGTNPAIRVALLAPWGREWEANAVDDKPLPFRSCATDYVRALLQEPMYKVTYLARNHALASANTGGGYVPVIAAWSRHDRPVQKLEDLGLMIILGRNSDDAPVVSGGTPSNDACIGVMQHDSKMVYVMKPLERSYIADAVKKGLNVVKSVVAVYAYGSEDERQLWINERRVDGFPVSAEHRDVITLQEGVSYVGLMPLPATDLGREQEVLVRYEYPLLTLNSLIRQSDESLPENEETYGALSDATAGWIVELGDKEQYGSFEAFRQHMLAAKLQTRWVAEEHTLHVSYSSGDDTLEMGYLTTFERPQWWTPVPPSKTMAYQRVNGQWPYPDVGVDLDCPLGQLGRAARLEKAGATLETAEGQMALLKVEPLSGTYEGVNPFIDPTPFELRTPEGVTVRSEGPLGCGRITVCPKQNTIWVDYCLPPPEGDRAAELLQQDVRGGATVGESNVNPRQKRFFRPEVDVRNARRDSARALLVTGLAVPPKVLLNGELLAGPFPTFSAGDRTWFRIPIAP